jgi:hypothetical protein
VNAGPKSERLPPSVSGLFDVAYAAYAGRIWLYLGLAAFVFVADCIVEVAIPAANLDTPAGELKVIALWYASIFADAYVVATVALGVAARVAGEEATPRRLTAAALARWLPVIATSVIVQAVVFFTNSLSGLGPLPDPPALVFVTAPLVWLVWGMLSLALPITALAEERPAFAVFAGLRRAIAFSMRRPNLSRLAIVSFVSIVPALLQDIAFGALVRYQIPRPFFWANFPIDALTVGPVAAVQTIFAIDMARRAADQRSA